MRTTLDVDDDLLSVARALARNEGRSLGRVISDLARAGLRPHQPQQGTSWPPTFTVPAGASVFGPDEVAAELDRG